jgi:hypothetical protein
MSDPHADLASAIDQTLGAGIDAADPDQIMRTLGQELEQQTAEGMLVLSADEEPEAWVLGADDGAPASPQGMAGRFLGFYGAALRRELCDEQGGCIKEQYNKMLSGGDLRANLTALAPAVLAAIGASATLVAPAIVATLVAAWLLRVGLQQWCAASAAAGAPATPAAPPAP